MHNDDEDDDDDDNFVPNEEVFFGFFLSQLGLTSTAVELSGKLGSYLGTYQYSWGAIWGLTSTAGELSGVLPVQPGSYLGSNRGAIWGRPTDSKYQFCHTAYHALLYVFCTCIEYTKQYLLLVFLINTLPTISGPVLTFSG